MKEYNMYKSIIDDFINDIIKKNNITDLIEIYNIYCIFYKNMYFSKENGADEFYDFELYTNDTNEIGEFKSDKMKTKGQNKYLGMFMVNGDGVCRHINVMLYDIYKQLGYKSFKLIGNPNNDPKTIHNICGVLDKKDKIIYLDAMKKLILYEVDKEIPIGCSKLATDVKNHGYETINVFNINFALPFHDFTFYDSKFSSQEEIDKYLRSLQNIDDSIMEQGMQFRINHLKLYESISKFLHDKYDPKYKEKTLI